MAQATGPFIDPVTKRKIHFVEKGPRGAALMAEHFDHSRVEECMGGGSTFLFDFDSYGQLMR